MTTKRTFRPTIDSLENRLVLSFNLGHALHQFLPFIPDHSSKTPAHVTHQTAQSRGAYYAAHPAYLAAHPHLAARLASQGIIPA